MLWCLSLHLVGTESTLCTFLLPFELNLLVFDMLCSTSFSSVSDSSTSCFTLLFNQSFSLCSLVSVPAFIG